MKILYATSEAVPFCKTGGLADVAGSLPPALAAEGAQVAVILPMYQKVKEKFGGQLNFLCYDYVDDIDYLVNAYKQRCRHYRKSGCEILK